MQWTTIVQTYYLIALVTFEGSEALIFVLPHVIVEIVLWDEHFFADLTCKFLLTLVNNPVTFNLLIFYQNIWICLTKEELSQIKMFFNLKIVQDLLLELKTYYMSYKGWHFDLREFSTSFRNWDIFSRFLITNNITEVNGLSSQTN